MRNEGPENLAITGKAERATGRERPRIKFLKSLAEVTNTPEEQLLRRTRDRKLWKVMTTNILKEQLKKK